MRKESIHGSALFDTPLALQEPVRAYNMGIRYIGDVVNEQGQLLSFPQAFMHYASGMHHLQIWRNFFNLLTPFVHVLSLVKDKASSKCAFKNLEDRRARRW